MREFEKEIMKNFDIVINYYSSVDVKKANIYTINKKEYYEKICAYEILPEEEIQWIKNIEAAITTEMAHIKEIENNDKQ